MVAVVPLLRESDLLLRLGASGGIKRSFPVDFYLAFSPDQAADGTEGSGSLSKTPGRGWLSRSRDAG